jgi:hypothetical protein
MDPIHQKRLLDDKTFSKAGAVTDTKSKDMVAEENNSRPHLQTFA